MALPVLTSPVFELVIPSTKQKVKYRPFLVKEQKALLIAQHSEDQHVMFNSLVEVIKTCLFDKIDMTTLALFDIEYIFTQLRARSTGEISELVFSCLECGDPKAKIKVNLDLTKLAVVFNPDNKSDIQLTDTIGVKMKYPGITEVNTLESISTYDVETLFDLAIACVDTIYDENGVYKASESSKEELTTFMESLNENQFKKIEDFFKTIPKLEKEIEFDCPVCKFHHKQVLRGIDSFF